MTTQQTAREEDTLGSELSLLLERVPMLSDKLTLDLLNGIEVTKEQQRQRDGRDLIGRAFDALSGQGARRQQLIDRNLNAGLEATAAWLQALQVNQIQTDRGLVLLSDKLLETRELVKSVVQHHVALRDHVKLLERRLEELTGACADRLGDLETRLAGIELRSNARYAIDSLFASWEAGTRYRGLPVMLQLALALEELHWSCFYRYDRQHDDLRRYVVDRCLNRLRELDAIDPVSLRSTAHYLAPIGHESALVRSMTVRFFAPDVSETPVYSAIGAVAASPEQWSMTEAPATLPRVLSGQRMVQRMTAEASMRAGHDGV